MNSKSAEVAGVGSRLSTISVIVPAYNEEKTIGALLESLRQLKPEEIIVADGDSTDRTAEIAAQCATVVTSARGRGIQMNAGARESSGDVLLFLHADVHLGPDSLVMIRKTLYDPSIIGGNFDVRYQGGDWVAAIFTCVNRWRRRVGIFYGDSGIFCRRSVFEGLGGYQPWPILEDYDFARRLRKTGKLALLGEPIWASDRRWRNLGLFRTVWSWFWIQTLFFVGIRPERLGTWYGNARSGDSPVGVRPSSLNGRAGSFGRPEEAICGASRQAERAPKVTLPNGSKKE